MVASSKSTHRGSETTLRHAWLAALGLCAIARREAATAAEIAQEEATRLRRQGGALAEDAINIARGAAMTVGENLAPAVAELRAELEARLAPVLERFGFAHSVKAAPPKARKARKAGARPAAPRKATRRAAKGGSG